VFQISRLFQITRLSSTKVNYTSLCLYCRKQKASAQWFKTLIADRGFKPGFTQAGGWGTAPQLLDDFYYGTFPEVRGSNL
jgi:hypothetical protein